MSGCSFDVTCFTIIVRVIWEADVVIFGARNMSFGMPVASALAPWGTIERSRGTWEHKKGDLGVQVWIAFDLWWISGLHFEGFWRTLAQHVFCHACFQVTLFDYLGI